MHGFAKLAYACVMHEPEPQPKNKRARHADRRPTVADVARLAGVSPMTVSRVVNQESNVSSKARATVNAAIAQIGYIPNLAARSLAGGRQCRIALLYSNPSAAYLSAFLVGSLGEASALDAHIIVEHIAQTEDPAALVARLIGHRVDAVLLPPPLCDDAALLECLHAAGLPMAQIATGKPVHFAHAVTIDDAGAAYEITNRLITLGHKRIGFIAGNPNQTASALRQAGYERAHAQAGLFCDPALKIQGDYTYGSGMAAANSLLSNAARPSAIFASNDDMAAAVVSAAHRLHFDVPRDLSVCGFDDSAMATSIWPEITTVAQPIEEMAKRATRLLVDAVKLRNAKMDDAIQHAMLDYRLILRDSDAAPNHSL